MNKKLTNEQIKEKFGKYLKEVLSEMCRRVGVALDDVDFSDDNWFQKYKWTEEEQDDFKKWFVDYLYSNTEARREITNVFTKSKTQLRKAVDWFLFAYGWSFEKKERDE